MSEEINKNIETSVNELEKLFLLDFLPETKEEAQKILKNANIDTSQVKEKGLEILRNMLVEFEDDWRNISDDAVESEAVAILKRETVSNLSRETLINKITAVTQILNAKGLGTKLSAGVAHRNLDKETDQDLASLLRQIEYIAEQAGINVGEK